MALAPDAAALAAEPPPLEREEELLGLVADVVPPEAHDEVLRELRTAAVELHAVFASYAAERPLADGFADAPAGEAGPLVPPTAKGLPLPAWHQLCADTGVDGLVEVEDAFLKSAPADDPSPCLAEVQFLAAIVRLASSLADESLSKSLYTLLYECILPFARRDVSAAFSQIVGSRSYLLPYLDEIRSSFSGFGVSWEQWLKLWPQLRLGMLPGYPYWERQIFRALSENLGVLLRIFGFYAKMTLLRLLTSGPLSQRGSATGAGASSHALVIGKMEWLGFVKECKLFSKKLGNERTLRQLSLSPGPAVYATFPEFLAALVKLSFWRANPGLEEGNSEQIEAARREFRVRALPDCFLGALHNHVLPLAQRDSSQRFRARLAQDEGVQTLMRDYKEHLEETFLQLTADSDETAKTLDCPTALAWLEQCGVLGHAAVRAPPLASASGGLEASVSAAAGGSGRTIPSVLSIDDATDAFVEALPALACLGPAALEVVGGAGSGEVGDEGGAAAGASGGGAANQARLTSLRHFQEWLVRCGEIKYAGLDNISLADRTAGILQNLFERRTTESFILEAMLPASAERFDPSAWAPPPELSDGELSLLLGSWEHIELEGLPGSPLWEQPVFELLAQCMGPLLGIFGYYCRSSLHHAAPEAAGYIELHGWNDFIVDCNGVTKSFSAQRAAEIFVEAPKRRESLTFAEFVQTVVICAFQRSNTALLDLHKTAAPRLVPVEQSLHQFLNSNVLPLAKSRNLLDAHRTFQEDEELQRVLSEHSELLLQAFLTSEPLLSPTASDGTATAATEAGAPSSSAAPGGADDIDGGVDIEQFVAGMMSLFGKCDLHLSVWEQTVTPVQPGEIGLFVKRSYRSKFAAIDAKQAFLDTLLAEALVMTSSLPHDSGVGTARMPPSGVLEAVVRCAMAKYNTVDALSTAGKTAAFIDGVLLQTAEQVAVSKYVETHAPERFDASEVMAVPRELHVTDPKRAQEHKAWLSVWEQTDLSDLPGFPEWECAVFEQLQASWPTLLSIFIFYSRGYGGNAAGAHGSMTPWGFLQWADDSKVITKIFSDARVQDVFDYSVAAQQAAFSQLAVESAVANGGEGVMSFSCFVQSIVRCAVERANPKWRRDANGRLTTGPIPTYLIPVQDCLGRFLHNCVLRFSPRDPCLAFSVQLLRDEASRAVIEAREAEVMQLLSQISGVDSRLDEPARLPVDVDSLIKVYRDRSILGSSTVSLKGGRVVTSELTDGQVMQATADASTFVKGRAGGGFGADASAPPEQGLSAEEFVELIVRCAEIKYAQVPDMSLAQRLSAFLRVLLDGESPNAAVNAIVAPRQRVDVFNPHAEEPPAEWDEATCEAWMDVWSNVDAAQLPGYAQSARSIFLTLRANMLSLREIYMQYSKNNMAHGTLTLEAWDTFVRDASLVTRTMGVQRTTAIFEHSAVNNKLGQPVLRFPQFMQALVNISYLRSNPVSVLSAGRTKPMSLARSIEALITHLYGIFIDDRPAVTVADGFENGSRPAMRRPLRPALTAAQAGGREKQRFDGLLPVLRKNLYSRMFKVWKEYRIVSLEQSKTICTKFRKLKRGGKLSHLFSSWKTWLSEWNGAIHEAGYVLRPHLPLNQHSAFSHWRYWSHAPQLMTSVCKWYTQRVVEDDRRNASQYTLDTVERAVSLKQAFSTWERLHGQTVRAVSMTNHLQRRLCATLLLRVVDAWVRLTIQERGARLYKERRMGQVAPRVPATTPADGKDAAGSSGSGGGDSLDEQPSSIDQEAFLGRALEPRASAARPGAHAWALLEAKLQMHHLPGISEHLPRIHSQLQENLPSLCSVFRTYAKMHIQPSEGLLSLSCLQLHEWLLFCEEVGLSSVSEPQQQLLMASQFENAQRRHLHGGLMSLPEFLEAFVCTSVLARREDSRGHSIDVVTRVQRSLEALQPLVARDMAPGFRMAFWADPLAMKLLQVHDAELRQIFLSKGWLKGGGVSLADFESFVVQLGIVCEGYWVQPLGSPGCELSMTLEQVMEAFVDSLDMFAGESSSWLPTGLPYEGWLECLARCAVGLYGPLELLKLHQLLDCILRNVLHAQTIEQSANAVWLETRDALTSWANNSGGAAVATGSSAPSAAAATGSDAKKEAPRSKKGAKRGAKSGGKEKALSKEDDADLSEETRGPGKAVVVDKDASKDGSSVPVTSSSALAAGKKDEATPVAMAADNRDKAAAEEPKMQPRPRKAEAEEKSPPKVDEKPLSKAAEPPKKTAETPKKVERKPSPKPTRPAPPPKPKEAPKPKQAPKPPPKPQPLVKPPTSDILGSRKSSNPLSGRQSTAGMSTVSMHTLAAPEDIEKFFQRPPGLREKSDMDSLRESRSATPSEVMFPTGRP